MALPAPRRVPLSLHGSLCLLETRIQVGHNFYKCSEGRPSRAMLERIRQLTAYCHL